MRTSKQGLAEIAAHEGIVTSRYKDSVGVWTIGIGHTRSAGYPDPKTIHRDLSIDEIMEIFSRDITKFERRVTKAFPKGLSQTQFDAAVSFDFNTGAIDRASWVKQFNIGETARARKSFMNWRKPAEIISRRKKERDLFFDGKYSSDGTVAVYTATNAGAVEWSRGKRTKLVGEFVVRGPKTGDDESTNLKSKKMSTSDRNSRKSGLIAAILVALSAAALALLAEIQTLF